MKINIKLYAVIIVALHMFGLFAFTSFATEVHSCEIDCTEHGSFIIDYRYDDKALSDVPFSVYHVTTVDESNVHSYLECFQDMEVDIADSYDVNQWLIFRAELEAYINKEGITPDKVFYTDDAGHYDLDDLELGIYFIQAEMLEEDTILFYSDPILITVGSYDEEIGEWIYDYDIEPKIALVKLEDPDEPEEPDESEDPEELPQTGSYAYLTSPLAALGLIFLLLGVLMKYGSRRKNKD